MVTFDLDGGSHVIPIKFTKDTHNMGARIRGSIFLRDKYNNLLPSFTDNLPNGWSKDGMTYIPYNTSDELIITVTNCSSISFILASQHGKMSNYLELYDVDSSNEVVATTPRQNDSDHTYLETYYEMNNIPSGTHTIKVRNVVGNTNYSYLNRNISIVSYNS